MRSQIDRPCVRALAAALLSPNPLSASRAAGEAPQLVVRIDRDRLVGPFEHRRVAGMVRIETDVAARQALCSSQRAIIRILAAP